MKSWKEVPHLFANGKFKAKASFKDDEIPKKDWYENKGLITKVDIHNRIWIGNDIDGVQIMYCTLIARPISDMSDEEIKEIAGSALMGEEAISGYKEMLIEHSGLGRLWLTDGVYLLSIGVYPFDQDNPKDVIWRYDNEESK